MSVGPRLPSKSGSQPPLNLHPPRSYDPERGVTAPRATRHMVAEVYYAVVPINVQPKETRVTHEIPHTIFLMNYPDRVLKKLFSFGMIKSADNGDGFAKTPNHISQLQRFLS